MATAATDKPHACPCVHCTKGPFFIKGSLSMEPVCGGCFLEANGHPKICCATVTAAGWWDSKEGAYNYSDFKHMSYCTTTFKEASTSRLLRHRKYPPKTSGSVRLPGLNAEVSSSGWLEHGYMRTEASKVNYKGKLQEIIEGVEQFQQLRAAAASTPQLPSTEKESES